MNFNANQALNFVGKWLAIGVIGYFGWKLGGVIDTAITFF
jgi:hypothetical protein